MYIELMLFWLLVYCFQCWYGCFTEFHFPKRNRHCFDFCCTSSYYQFYDYYYSQNTTPHSLARSLSSLIAGSARLLLLSLSTNFFSSHRLLLHFCYILVSLGFSANFSLRLQFPLCLDLGAIQSLQIVWATAVNFNLRLNESDGNDG